MVADDGGLTVGGVGIGEAVGGLIVVADGGDTVEIVVGILNLAAVAILHFAEQGVAVVGVHVGRQGLRTHLDGVGSAGGAIAFHVVRVVVLDALASARFVLTRKMYE